MAKKKKKKNTSKLGCIVGCALLGLFLLCGGGAGIAAGIYFWTQPGGFSKEAIAGKKFDDSRDGLRKQIQELVADHRAGKTTALKEYNEIPESWFRATFGDEQGKQFAANFRNRAADQDATMNTRLEQAKKGKTDKIEIETYAPEGPLARKAFDAMKSRPTVYQVLLVDSTGRAGWDTVMLPCVYVNGSFRFFDPSYFLPK